MVDEEPHLQPESQHHLSKTHSKHLYNTGILKNIPLQLPAQMIDLVV